MQRINISCFRLKVQQSTQTEDSYEGEEEDGYPLQPRGTACGCVRAATGSRLAGRVSFVDERGVVARKEVHVGEVDGGGGCARGVLKGEGVGPIPEGGRRVQVRCEIEGVELPGGGDVEWVGRGSTGAPIEFDGLVECLVRPNRKL